MTATTTCTHHNPLAATYAITIPGVGLRVVSPTRHGFNNSDLYAERMNEIRRSMDGIADENLLAALNAHRTAAFGAILRDAETATDIREYAQRELPDLIRLAWTLSDYYAERTGITTVPDYSIFEWVHAHDGSHFLEYAMHQLLNIVVRRNCVAKGVPYVGPVIIDSAGLLSMAESIRGQKHLSHWH